MERNKGKWKEKEEYVVSYGWTEAVINSRKSVRWSAVPVAPM